MRVHLSYGENGIPVDLPDHTSVIEPRHEMGLPYERAAVLDALDSPLAGASLRSQLTGGKRVCVVFTDITRPTPNHRIIPWILEYLRTHGVKDDHITLLNATGTHRPNTPEELDRMLTPAVTRRYRVVNHEAERVADLVDLGTTRNGKPVSINRHFMEADVRIVTGFIEPHFFAGFSGGPKGIMPGVAGLRTIMENHGYLPIDSPHATFGITEGNPIWEEMAEIARMAGSAFLLNVTLNRERHLTGVYSGELFAAHRAGIEAIRSMAMARVDAPFDVVVTSNNGYPLDQNLYQAVKGLSAAARICRPDGLIILAAECREGLPAGSPFESLLHASADADALLTALAAPGLQKVEQWQVQIFGRILREVDVHLYSALDEDTVRRAHLTPCRDIAARVREQMRALGPSARIAVLPEGPMVIPYVGR